jgi:hypothetical protein
VTAVSPDLAARAALAWEMLSRAKNPMPAWAALDWLQEEHQDREECKRALYAAAAGSLMGSRPERHGNEGATVCRMIADVKFADAHEDINGVPSASPSHMGIRWWYGSMKSPALTKWLKWCDRADAALALCRAIEAA